MTEKQKALELIELHMTSIGEPVGSKMEYSELLKAAKGCAIVTAKEVLMKLYSWKAPRPTVEFWQQVLVEIDKF